MQASIWNDESTKIHNKSSEEENVAIVPEMK